MNSIEISNRLQKCFSSVIHDVMRDRGHKNFTLPPNIRPTKEKYRIAGQIFTMEGSTNPEYDHHETILAWTGFLSKAPANKIIICQPNDNNVAFMGELSAETLQSKNVIETHKITDLFLEILNESIAVDTTASNKPIIEVKAAINTKKKNNAPKYIPKGISLNNEAIVTNNKPGPESGWIPKANKAGNITNPAKIAIAVSKNTTIPTLPGISLFFLSK